MKEAKLVMCDKGHFYDGGKYDECPHCKKSSGFIRCEMGHFYDGGKYYECPHCNSTAEHGVTEHAAPKFVPKIEEPATPYIPELEPEAELPKGAFTDDEPTIANKQDFAQTQAEKQEPENSDMNILTDAPRFSGAPGQDDMTVHYFQKVIGAEPVVGWLVCVAGVHCGEDFKIKSGRNFIGRSGNMNISLSGDAAVSRDKHAILSYAPQGNSFLIQPGDSSALCYLNGEPLLVPTKLKLNDLITLGETDLMFVPFCSEAFSWNKK